MDQLMQYIIDDVNKYDGVRRLVKSSLLERMMTDEVPLEKLHMNPNDEFCDVEIGPNLNIVAAYEKVLEQSIKLAMPVFEERIVVEKMSPDGYMILNGHHRWAAAYKRGAKKVRVHLVNVTHEADVHEMMKTTENDRRATLDMDEFVFASEGDEKEPIGPLIAMKYEHGMRLGVPTLIHELQRRGYDIWAYTADYHSREYLESFFEAYDVKVTGIVNGLSKKKAKRTQKKKSLTEAIARKYVMSVTLSREAILYTNSKTKEYEIVDIDQSETNFTRHIMDEIERIEKECDMYIKNDDLIVGKM